MELEEGEIPIEPPQQQNPTEPDLWALDLEELERMFDEENQLKEQQLQLIRKSVEESTNKNQLQQHKLHSVETDIENRCKELGIKEKQLTSVEGKLQLICREVEIKEREYKEIGGRLKERIREVKEKEEQLKLIQTKICEYDRRLRLKQEDCNWQLEMMQKLTTERDEVERKMKMEIDEREKEIEDKLASLAVIDDLIKDRDRDHMKLDMLFKQSVVAVDKFLKENEIVLKAKVAKIGEFSKEIKVKEEKLCVMEKLIDTIQKKKDSIKAMREKVIQLLQEVESRKKDNDNESMKERELELEKKEEQFQEVVKKLELSKRDNELLKEIKLEVEDREKRLLEEVEYIDWRLTEYELKERQFKERVRELDSREEECDERMNTLLSKEKQLTVRFKELESNEKEYEERTKKLLGLKETELEERTRELRSKEIELEEQTRELGLKEKKLEEQTRELESKEKQHEEEFECNMKKFLSEWEHVNGRVKEQESEKNKFEAEKNKFEAQVREHELKEKLYEVRVQELSLKEKKFEIQLKQLESKEKEYEERLKELASKEKQHVAQHSQGPQAVDNESSPTTDGSNFQLLLNEKTNEPKLYVNGILVDLQSTSDPAKLVLDVIQKPVIRLDQKGDKGAIIKERHIILLEQLMRISPDIKSHVREEAMKLALDLKANMGANTENSLVVLGFLLLLSAYGLVSSFDEDEVFKHFEFAAQHRQAVELFRTLGFMDKISDFVQNLINKQRIVEAVRFICAYKLAAKFQPVHLLNQHMQRQRQRSKKFCKRFKKFCKRSEKFCKWTKQKVEIRKEEIAELRNVLECVLDNNIGSQNLVKEIEDRIHKLERHKGSLASSNPIEEVNQQQQPKPKKRANATTYYPSQGSDYSKRCRTVTPPPPPFLHPQFHRRHVFIPPPRPGGMIPGQFSYYPPQDYYSHADTTVGVGRYGAGPDHFYRSGPYPPI